MRWNGPFLTYIGKAGPGKGLGLVFLIFSSSSASLFKKTYFPSG
jgi:hypothetical protein